MLKNSAEIVTVIIWWNRREKKNTCMNYNTLLVANHLATKALKPLWVQRQYRREYIKANNNATTTTLRKALSVTQAISTTTTPSNKWSLCHTDVISSFDHLCCRRDFPAHQEMRIVIVFLKLITWFILNKNVSIRLYFLWDMLLNLK